MTALTINANSLYIPLSDASVHCIATSPPYYGLREYDGVEPSAWPEVSYAPMPGLPPMTIPAMVCCLGHEPTPEAYVAHLVAIGRELRRVLREDGVFWMNLGDSYAGSGKGGQSEEKRSANWRPTYEHHGFVPTNLKPKTLIGVPWRAAFALQADGWYLRQDVIWAKGVSFCKDYNGSVMPESVTDRCTKAHEYIFQFAKNERYYFDMEAVKEPSQESSIARQLRGISETHKNVNGAPGQSPHSMNQPRSNDKMRETNATRQPRSVWAIMPKPYRGSHYAVWPEALVEPMILAGSPLHGVVLDPFCGSGTTGRVAIRHNRCFIGLDLSRQYLGELAAERMDNVQRVLME